MATKPKKHGGPYSAPRQLRFTKDLNERVQKYQEQFHIRTGIELNFSAAVRLLVEKGLEAKA